MSVTEIAQIADRRMNEEKSCYYENYFSCRQRISEAPFSLTRKYVRVYYRKTVNDRYENTVMEILPVEDYSVNNRQVFLYVKINM